MFRFKRTLKSNSSSLSPTKNHNEDSDIKSLNAAGHRFFGPDKGALLLSGEINEESAAQLIDELHASSDISDDPIFIFINSPGGDVHSGLAIINTILVSPVPVIGVVTGLAASMALKVLQACHYRAMLPQAVCFWHNMISWNPEPIKTPEESEKRARDYKVLNEHLQAFFFKRLADSGLTQAMKTKKFNENDISFFAAEAKRYRMVDAIIERSDQYVDIGSKLIDEIMSDKQAKQEAMVLEAAAKISAAKSKKSGTKTKSGRSEVSN
jgi:ATP-dependent Clp protease protease subunit